MPTQGTERSSAPESSLLARAHLLDWSATISPGARDARGTLPAPRPPLARTSFGHREQTKQPRVVRVHRAWVQPVPSVSGPLGSRDPRPAGNACLTKEGPDGRPPKMKSRSPEPRMWLELKCGGNTVGLCPRSPHTGFLPPSQYSIY